MKEPFNEINFGIVDIMLFLLNSANSKEKVGVGYYMSSQAQPFRTSIIVFGRLTQ